MKVVFGSPVSRCDISIMHPAVHLVSLLDTQHSGNWYGSFLDDFGCTINSQIWMDTSKQFHHLIILKSYCCIPLCQWLDLNTSKLWNESFHSQNWTSKVHSVTFSPADPLVATLFVKDMVPLVLFVQSQVMVLVATYQMESKIVVESFKWQGHWVHHHFCWWYWIMFEMQKWCLHR